MSVSFAASSISSPHLRFSQHIIILQRNNLEMLLFLPTQHDTCDTYDTYPSFSFLKFGHNKDIQVFLKLNYSTVKLRGRVLPRLG